MTFPYRFFGGDEENNRGRVMRHYKADARTRQ